MDCFDHMSAHWLLQGKLLVQLRHLTYCGQESWTWFSSLSNEAELMAAWNDEPQPGLCNPDLNHSDMNIWRSQHHADCSALLKQLILVFSTIYLETYANLKFT